MNVVGRTALTSEDRTRSLSIPSFFLGKVVALDPEFDPLRAHSRLRDAVAEARRAVAAPQL